MDAHLEPDITTPKANLDMMVVEKLRERILTGELASGTHLSELEISRTYDVSRTPVREALCALAADGLIEMIPNRGAFVMCPNAKDVQENRTIYAHLVALTAKQAHPNLTTKHFEELERYLEDFSEPGSQFEDKRKAFHHTLKSCANTPSLSDMLSFLERRLPRPILPVVTKENELKMVKQGYEYLLTSLKNQRSDVAEKTLRDVMMLNFSVTNASSV